MTITTDYHMHSTFSPDAEHAPEAMCQQALDIGLQAIAITEHIEWHPKGRWLFPQVDAYFETIADCQQHFGPQGLRVYTGVELGNPHNYLNEALAVIKQYPFDVIIGSMHWLGAENIHLASCFENRDPDDVYAEYFMEMAQMSETCDVNFIAHFDRIFWPGTALHGQPHLERLEPIVRKTLATIARRHQGLELNTRFLNHTPNWNQTIVSVLRWFREEGGQHVLVNSDAHRTRELGRNHQIAESLIAQAGFAGPARLRDLNTIPMHTSPALLEMI